MRILRVAQKLYPDVTGGGAYHVHAMSRDQAAMGHEVTVLTVRHDESLPSTESRDGYNVIRFDPAVEVLGNDVSPGLARYLGTVDGFDVVHAHSHLYSATNLAAMMRPFNAVPVAITNHGLYTQNAPEWVFDLYLRSLGRWTFNRADAVFCYTDVDRRRLRELGVSSRIQVVPNGIDTDRFDPSGPNGSMIDHDGPTVLFVGRLVGGKRPRDVIAATDELRSVYPELRTYLCGNGPLQPALESEATERGLSEHVSFLGHVPYEKIPGVYRSADVLVLPSRSEGLPRTVLEAMATETPVVVSDLPQVAAIASSGGLTAPVGDVEELADCVEDLLEDDHRQSTLGERGRTLVEENHDWSDTVDRTTAALAELVSNDTGSR